jgi:hypothetical protein
MILLSCNAVPVGLLPTFGRAGDRVAALRHEWLLADCAKLRLIRNKTASRTFSLSLLPVLVENPTTIRTRRCAFALPRERAAQWPTATGTRHWIGPFEPSGRAIFTDGGLRGTN